MSFEIFEQHEQARTVVGLRDVIGQYSDEGQLWERFEPLLRAHDIRPIGPGGATMHDIGFKASEVDVEVWVPVATSINAPTPLVCHDIPAQRVLITRVKGAYAQIHEACMALADYAQDHGLQPNGLVYNVYVSPPGPGVDEVDYVTQVCLPIAEKVDQRANLSSP